MNSNLPERFSVYSQMSLSSTSASLFRWPASPRTITKPTAKYSRLEPRWWFLICLCTFIFLFYWQLFYLLAQIKTTNFAIWSKPKPLHFPANAFFAHSLSSTSGTSQGKKKVYAKENKEVMLSLDILDNLFLEDSENKSSKRKSTFGHI